MQKSVDNLEALFQKAETDLNYLSRKLQVENGQAFKDENNPIKMMTKITEIKTEYSALVKDIINIQAAQKDTMDSFQSMLQSMTQVLGKLEGQCELSSELGESTETMCEELSQFFGVPIINFQQFPSRQPDDASLSRQDETAGVGTATTSKDLRSAESEPCQDTAGGCKKTDSVNPQVRAHERRAHISDFTEVATEEFMSVSELVRGKVKLEDLNRTYKLLWQHFKEEGKKAALTPQEMNSMGLRVSGATGEAKLKVLRALKLCQISRNGEVKLS